MADLDAKRDALLALIGQFESCAVAFSGGVDSAVLAKAAQIVLGEQAVAVTSKSPSLPSGELDLARDLAKEIGIRHEVIETSEIDDPNYTRNASDRCFHCKTHLYDELDKLAESQGVAVVLGGANVDDLGDYRPGLLAASNHGVRSPLAECRITKAEVREIARAWELPVWDKPAGPCLSSRIAYGEEVTAERLAMIDAAEQFLRSLGLSEVRVRFHRNELARLEVPSGAVSRLAENATRLLVADRLKELGFKYVTLDLEGFRSGSMNEVLSVESLK